MANYKYVLLLIYYFTSIEYSIAQNGWLQKTSLPGPGRFDAAVFTIGNCAYICCGDTLNTGIDYLNDVWKYDQVADAWTQLANFPGSPRRNPVSFTIDSIGYLGGGFTSSEDFQDFWEYSSITNNWTQKNNISCTLYQSTLGFSIGQYGYVLFAGGGSNLFRYDIQNDVWDLLNTAPFLSRGNAMSFVIGSNAYIGLGAWEKDLWKFESSTGNWIQMQDFPGLKRQAVCAFSIGGFGYVGCGFDTLGYYPNDFYKYDTTTNQWNSIGVFPGWPVTESVGFSINGKGYLCTGAPPMPPASQFLWEFSPFVGIPEFYSGNIFNVFPNPFVNTIILNTDFTKEYVFRLFDSNGRLIIKSEINNQTEQLQTVTIKPGLYLYQIADLNSKIVQTGRLIKACL